MTFIDSAGIRALLQLADATDAGGGEIVLLARPDSYVLRLLEVRGLIHRFRLAHTRADAVASPP
jgi:anti-anti-sigma factor